MSGSNLHQLNILLGEQVISTLMFNTEKRAVIFTGLPKKCVGEL